MTEYFSRDFHQTNVELAEKSATVLSSLMQNNIDGSDQGFTTQSYSTNIGREPGHWTTYNRVRVLSEIHASIFEKAAPPNYLHDTLFQLSLSLVGHHNSSRTFAQQKLPHDKDGFREYVDITWMSASFNQAKVIELFSLYDSNGKATIEMHQNVVHQIQDEDSTVWDLWIVHKSDLQIVPFLPGTITLA